MNAFRFLNHKDCDQQYSMGFCSSISVGPRTLGGQSDGELVARLSAVVRKGAWGLLCSAPGALRHCSPAGDAYVCKTGAPWPLFHSTALGASAPAPDPGAFGEGLGARDPSSLDSGLMPKPPSVPCPNKCSSSQPGGRGISVGGSPARQQGAANPASSWAPNVTHGSPTSAAPASTRRRVQAFPLQPLHPAGRTEALTRSWLRAVPSFPGSPPPWKLLPQLHSISSSTALQRGDF